MAGRNIVVVGAGVAGLTTALALSENPRNAVTVAAKHMPGDYDIEYASPWAGANYMPVSLAGTEAALWDEATWKWFANLAQRCPEAGVHFQKCEIYSRAKDAGSTTQAWFAELLSQAPWWRSVVPDFRTVPTADLPRAMQSATSFTSVCINTAIYLPWLVSQCLKNGVKFKRRTLTHVTDAAAVGVHHSGTPADLIVNCTGLAAAVLGGVEDRRVYPARGQIVLVRNEIDRMCATSGTDDGEDEALYVMARAAGGGTVLGGCYQKGRWESQPDPSLALRIMQRCVTMCPELTGGKGVEGLDVVRHAVGLRPVREGGARVEKDEVGGHPVVHNYGHGGAGYQCSYGCAQAAVRHVDELLGRAARL